MNFIRAKYRSLFYSLLIHIFIGLLIFFLFYYVRETQKSYSLVDLKSVNLCSPAVECFCTSEVKEVSVKKVSAQMTPKVTPVKRQKPVKEVVKQKPVAKKQRDVARVEPLPVPKEMEKKVEEEAEPVIEQVQALEESKKETKSSVLTTKQEPSYEARYMEDNLALINALIKKNLSYPRVARKRGLQGKAIVFFTLDTEGEITQIEASGELASILKKSAIKTIEKASKYFPQTKEILSLQIPIVYKLN